jgi:alkylhydroperoxidase family enzyme
MGILIAESAVPAVGIRRQFTEAQIVELTLRVTLCGFFNRFNDALQIDDELGDLHQGHAVLT